MKRFNPQRLLAVSRRLGHVRGLGQASDGIVGADVEEQAMNADSKIVWSRLLESAQADCESLGLLLTAEACRRGLAMLRRDDVKWSKMELQGEVITGRLEDESDLGIFLALDRNEADRYEHYERGWEDIIERFPRALRDIEEAQKCYALERYAAAVFHSLRVVEWGLVDLGDAIGATDHMRGWNATEKRLAALLKANHGDLAPEQRAHRPRLEQLAQAVERLKMAWRNKISHAAETFKMADPDFTPAIADEILSATRSFMRTLADSIAALAEDAAMPPASPQSQG
jgi:hypothetical protein